MKQSIITIATIVAAGLLISSCAEKITLDQTDESRYDNVGKLIGSVRDLNTNKTTNVVDLRSGEYKTGVVFTLSRAPKKGLDVKVSYDAAVLDSYNKSHGTSFELFPESQVSLQNGGSIVMAPDEKRSYSLGLTLAPFGDKEEKTYLLPLKATVTESGVTVSEERLIYLVRNMSFQSVVKDKDGRKGVVVFFEVNNTNPLNALQFETEDGHLLIDYLVLFAYNINYDAEKGKVYCFANPQCQYILDHYDEEIRPLRERGIKVIVSVLGNHDAAGLAQLSDAGARAFAQEMAAMCYGYGFDGINLDDEYSNSPDLSVPWFTNRSQAAGNRLYFELKRAMPDKIMLSYQYGSALGNGPVDGFQPGDYMDICVGDYGRRGVAYTGMNLSQCSYQSSEFAQWRYAPTEGEVNNFISSNYGYWMIFSLWNDSRNLQRDFNSANYLAKGIYGSNLKKPSIFYPATTSLDSSPVNW